MNHEFDVCVIGAGAAGLSAAIAAAHQGARTALVERDRIGGACTWRGCIPARALQRSAQVYALARSLGEYGILDGAAHQYDGSEVMTHVRAISAKVAARTPPDFLEARGVELLRGPAEFEDNSSIAVNGEVYRAKRFIIATGSVPFVPQIENIGDAAVLTSDNVFDLLRLPRSVIIIGGGMIGTGFAQAFARLEVEVTIIERNDRILLREDEEAARVLEEVFVNEGIRIYAGRRPVRIERGKDRLLVTMESILGDHWTVEGDSILIAAGRQPALEGLRLNRAGVETYERGIVVDGTMKTSADNIYACGDVVGHYRYAGTADQQARIAVGNALGNAPRSIDYRFTPWSLFTSPELARAGMTEKEARQVQGDDVRVFKVDYRDNTAAIADMTDRGLVKIVTDGRHRILGSHIVGENAGELIHEVIIARTAGMRLDEIAQTPTVYPSLSRLITAVSFQSQVKEAARERERAAVP